MFKSRKDKEGLKTKKLLDKVKQRLNNIQFEGEERIIFILGTLKQELVNQGYELEEETLYIPIWQHKGCEIELQIGDKRIGGKRIGE